MKTCAVTVWNPHARRHAFGRSTRPCGQPVDRYGLCAKHAADKERLS